MARGNNGRRAGAAGSAAAPPCRGRKGGGRRKVKLTGGSQPSVAQRKRKGKGGDGLTREAGWAASAERVAGALLFFFSFSNFIFKSFFNSNSNQTFANFSQEFYRLFRDHTSNQKPCKPKDDAHTLVVSKFIKLSLIFLELNLISNLISLNP
jgi:hypothetical protein